MSSAITPWDLKRAYQEGQNLMKILRQEAGATGNDEKMIELSYDLQSGSYVGALADPVLLAHKREYCRHVAALLESLGPVSSLLDAGMGEGNMLWLTLSQMVNPPLQVHGFDLCWSRMAVAREWLEKQEPCFEIQISTGSLTEIPYMDNSVDVVWTNHSIEPNHGREAAILSELHRVCRRYVVMLEPAYELGSDEARKRMDEHGYCRNLAGTAKELGFRVHRHEIFAGNRNPRNPTAVLILAKDENATPVTPRRCCPVYKTELTPMRDCWYSKESMRAYPILNGIPCLRSSQSIVASKLAETFPTDS
ncbi:hypothetical protein GCM10023213_30540 [Prosthecobacter algae]|uniref:Methyltransferase domain-containing protein n=1 Tax=Prosthecobacter algae TaxID=1144682 RepID=A0ABP9PA08_9BACT